MQDHQPAPGERCRNCESELAGPFCHACGQKAVTIPAALGDFVHDATHEFLHVDGKIAESVRLLVTRPGRLTNEFLAGRRARYISPLRLYLTFSVLFFALAVMGTWRDNIIQVGPGKGGGSATAQDEQVAERLGNAIMRTFPKAMFVLMPAFALLTWVVWQRRQPFYVAHLYYAIHFHAFTFLVLCIAVLLGLGGRVGKGAGSIVFMTTIPYHFAALRTVFQERWPATIMKGTLVGLLYWALILGAMAAIVFPEISTIQDEINAKTTAAPRK